MTYKDKKMLQLNIQSRVVIVNKKSRRVQMNKLKKICLLWLLLLSPFGANAIILDYTGNPFTQVTTDGSTAPSDLYTTSDSVTGWIELTAVLDPNLSAQFVSPLSFSFSDGINTFTESSPLTTSNFQFWTDAGGQLSGWNLQMQIFAPTAGGGTSNTIFVQNFDNLLIGPTVVQDGGIDTLCGPTSDSTGCAFFGEPSYRHSGRVNNDPGVWAYRVTSVPEPGTLLLMGLGLAGMGFSRKRKAA